MNSESDVLPGESIAPRSCTQRQLAEFAFVLVILTLFLQWASTQLPNALIYAKTQLNRGDAGPDRIWLLALLAPGPLIVLAYSLRRQIVRLLFSERAVSLGGLSQTVVERLEVAGFRIVGLVFFIQGTKEVVGRKIFSFYARGLDDPALAHVYDSLSVREGSFLVVSLTTAALGLFVFLWADGLASYLHGGTSAVSVREKPPVDGV